MARPRNPRQVHALPQTDYFKPRGIPLRQLAEVTLAVEELEALRLADLEGMEQSEAAQQMQVSRPTFSRIIAAARAKVADALVNGKALRIEGGTFELAERLFACGRCGHRWGAPFGTGRPDACPRCQGDAFHRVTQPDGPPWRWGRRGRGSHQ